MGYDRGGSFPLDFKPNRIPFGSKSKGKLPRRSYPIQCERKGKYSFLSVRTWKNYNNMPEGGGGVSWNQELLKHLEHHGTVILRGFSGASVP